ncbi:MAG: YCF48-related protein [Bacteroidota bacterium]
MRKLIYLLLAIVAYNQLHSGWIAQQSNTTEEFRDVFFRDSTLGWAVGNAGEIRKTTNGGAIWFAQTSGTSNTLFGVHFVNDTVGWVVGQGGTIRKTTNGGATWFSQTSGTGNTLFAVHFANDTVGWVVGQGGTIRKTTNGGVSWVGQSSMVNQILLDVHFVDADFGCVVGQNGTILLTYDGGANWFSQSLGGTFPLYAVHFVNYSYGWIVGASGTIYKTTSGGTYWLPQTSNTSNWLYGVNFLDINRGWVVGDGGTILATTNGGSQWVAQSSGLQPPVNFNSVKFVSLQKGWIVGGSGKILVQHKLSPPSLSAPSDSATNISLLPQFTWVCDPFSAFDRIQVSKFSNFSVLAFNDIAYDTSKTIPIQFKLDTNTLYYWRVKSYDPSGDSSVWSNVRRFTTEPLLLPPNLVSPANNSASLPTSLNFVWDSSFNATKYIIQISTDSLFASVFKNDTTDFTNYSINTLSFGTTYYWRVRSINTSQISAWSAVRKFSTSLLQLYQIQGTIKYANTAQTPMNNCIVRLLDSLGQQLAQTVTDSLGNFTFSGFTNGVYSLNISTTKSWGGINISDVNTIRLHLNNVQSQFTPLIGVRLLAADINQSSSVSIVDANQMRRRLNNLQPYTWTAPNYVFHPTILEINGANVSINIQSLCSGDVNGSYIPPNN